MKKRLTLALFTILTLSTASLLMFQQNFNTTLAMENIPENEINFEEEEKDEILKLIDSDQYDEIINKYKYYDITITKDTFFKDIIKNFKSFENLIYSIINHTNTKPLNNDELKSTIESYRKKIYGATIMLKSKTLESKLKIKVQDVIKITTKNFENIVKIIEKPNFQNSNANLKTIRNIFNDIWDKLNITKEIKLSKNSSPELANCDKTLNLLQNLYDKTKAISEVTNNSQELINILSDDENDSNNDEIIKFNIKKLIIGFKKYKLEIIENKFLNKFNNLTQKLNNILNSIAKYDENSRDFKDLLTKFEEFLNFLREKINIIKPNPNNESEISKLSNASKLNYELYSASSKIKTYRNVIAKKLESFNERKVTTLELNETIIDSFNKIIDMCDEASKNKNININKELLNCFLFLSNTLKKINNILTESTSTMKKNKEHNEEVLNNISNSIMSKNKKTEITKNLENIQKSHENEFRNHFNINHSQHIEYALDKLNKTSITFKSLMNY